MPLLPVAFGGILSAILAHFGSAPPRALAVTLGAAVALGPLGFLLGRYLPRAGLFVALALYGAFLELAGGTALAQALGPHGEAPAVIAPWVLACFGVWLGWDTSWEQLRGRARRVLLPLAAILAFGEAAQLLLVRVEPAARTLLLAAFVLGLFVGAPLVLRLLFATRRIDLSIAGVPVRLWDLGVPVATASVAGALGSYRTIFVTSQLISVMEPPEGAAVLRHELGHGELGHLRVLALLAAAGLVVAEQLEPLGWWLALVAGLAAVGFVALARRLEHDADLYAAAPDRANADAVMSALLKCCAANGQPPEKGGLRHPSVARRIELLQRATIEPGFAEARLRRSRLLLGALSGVALLILGAGALRALDGLR